MALALGDKYGRMGNLGLQEKGQVEKSMDKIDFQSVLRKSLSQSVLGHVEQQFH